MSRIAELYDVLFFFFTTVVVTAALRYIDIYICVCVCACFNGSCFRFSRLLALSFILDALFLPLQEDVGAAVLICVRVCMVACV